MSAQADRLARKALALLHRYGQAATLLRCTAGVYDPALSTAPTTITTHPVQVLVQADSGRGEGQELVPSGTVKVGRRKLLVAAAGLPVTPGPGDEVGIALDGLSWRVLRTDPPVQLQGTPIIYVLRVVA
ncbi:hypothetical protein [Myxococcus sp. NMCA1]|uniref:hypothetical protein n=1 Tax=Myxococcus sp. NMCA1 TaxID=2996785 RepID=UPI0022866981|nr:hypothetical protein [Myxococcus sp. NMCA1]WAM23825.1 hypothetical protein OZ403_25120 [Myxococcus sp. NMCA1]